jgi:GTP-binding protein Era
VDATSEGAFRSGFVAVVGRPNVGKSTLINAWLGQSVAAVSPKPQTTRRRQLGILTRPEAQIVFVDTPGLHRPVHRLGESLNRTAEAALMDADIVVIVCDLSEKLTEEDLRVASAVRSLTIPPPLLLALNKADRVPPGEIDTRVWPFVEAFSPVRDVRAVSALEGRGLQGLLDRVIQNLPPGPAYFPEEDVTDMYERDLAADLIRTAALALLRQEVPHSLAVRIEEYRERDQASAYIAATLLVERESQKGIVIGRGGAMLKQIGARARAEIEKLVDRKVYLDLRVRVLPNWRDDPDALQSLGFSVPAVGPRKRR